MFRPTARGVSPSTHSFTCNPPKADIDQVLTKGVMFKLKTFNQFDSEKYKAKTESPWVRSMQYTPEGLDMEPDKEFVGKLGHFAQEFTAPREQLSAMFEELRTILSGATDE